MGIIQRTGLRVQLSIGLGHLLWLRIRCVAKMSETSNNAVTKKKTKKRRKGKNAGKVLGVSSEIPGECSTTELPKVLLFWLAVHVTITNNIATLLVACHNV